MAITDLFSKRMRRARGDVPDVYQYDHIPEPLRVQIVHILRESIGTPSSYDMGRSATARHQTILGKLRREYGVFTLHTNTDGTFDNELYSFVLNAETERVLDAVELCAQAIDEDVRHHPGDPNAKAIADAALAELNGRFREHGLGYQVENGTLVRVDSTYLHAEGVKPALRLLSDTAFSGAQEEFLGAHEHYRKGDTKEALNDALKSLESTLKVICKRQGWAHAPNVQAKGLLDIVFNNGLIPPFWQTQWAGLRSILENGVPTPRNRLSGHGQGAEPTEVPPHLASYVLHLTASAIVFLVESERAL